MYFSHLKASGSPAGQSALVVSRVGPVKRFHNFSHLL